MPWPKNAEQPPPPTWRQLEVLRAYVRGGTHHEAARLLGLSVRTVQAHLNSLRIRLGVHNEAQVVYVLWLGYRDHLVSCPKIHHEGCLPELRLVYRQRLAPR